MAGFPRLAPIAGAALLALAVTGRAGGPAWAEAADGQQIRDWTVRCEPAEGERPRRCLLIQNLTQKDGDKSRHLMSTVVGRFGNEAAIVVLFTVPLGVFLPAGMVVKVEGHDETKELGYRACTRGGCRAAFQPDDRWLGLLKAGSRATVTIKDGAGKSVALPVSLLGLTKGLDEITAQ